MRLLRDAIDRDLEHFLTPQTEFAPFPRADERPPWEQLDEELKQAIVARGVERLEFQWPPLPATLYMEYVRNGDREGYQRPYFERREALGELVVAECVEARGRFVDQIVNGVWAILEESSWVVPAHNGQRWKNEREADPLPDEMRRYIDLFAAETGALLAWTVYLLGERVETVSALLRRRTLRELTDRIIEPYLAHDDFWWMSFDEVDRKRVNNWNPWCNSNCLAVALLADDNDERRAHLVRKACRSIDFFIESYGQDGGCDEGPSYWGHAAGALFDFLELLFLSTGGRVDLSDDERIQNMGRFIARAHIAGDYYVNFADCVPKLSPPADLVYRFGERIGDDALARFGAYLRHGDRSPRRESRSNATVANDAVGSPRDMFRRLHAIFGFDAVSKTEGRRLLPRAVWFESTEVAIARQEEGSEKGFAVAVKGGHNGESHNHNDVGQLIVFHDGLPILVDPGVGTYTAKTFSDARYEIWTMQSAYHNLPTVGGFMQRPGSEFRASEVHFADEGDRAGFSVELGGAYPEDAGIRRFTRTLTLDRALGTVVVTDALDLEDETDILFSFMTPVEPKVTDDGVRLGPTHGVLLETEGVDLTHKVEGIDIPEGRLRPHWGPALFRLVCAARLRAGELTFRLSA